MFASHRCMKTDNPPFFESDNSPPHSGDFQILLYDKPWYRPGYFIGALLACLYIDFQREFKITADMPVLTVLHMMRFLTAGTGRSFTPMRG